MRKTKRHMKRFSIFDHTSMEAHLEKMAGKGWKLDKITRFFWHYHRIEPANLHYTVTYYPSASFYDPGPSDREQTFHDYCALAGWELVATQVEMQVFCNERENPVEIETDAALQVETIDATARKEFLPVGFVFTLIFLFLSISSFVDLFRDPIDFLSSGVELFSIILWVALSLFIILQMKSYYAWHKKATAAAELDGSFLSTHGQHRIQLVFGWFFHLHVGFALLYLLLSGSWESRLIVLVAIAYTIIWQGSVGAVRRLLKRFHVSPRVNRAISLVTSLVVTLSLSLGLSFCIVQARGHGYFGTEPYETYQYYNTTQRIYHNELPLTVQDLIDVDYDGYSYEWTAQSSPLLAVAAGRQSARMDGPNMPYLSYSIYKIRLPLLYNLCLNGFMEETPYRTDSGVRAMYHFEAVDAAPWGMETVYRSYLGDSPVNGYLLCWSDRIVEISLPEAPTPEQIAIITQVLAGA